MEHNRKLLQWHKRHQKHGIQDKRPDPIDAAMFQIPHHILVGEQRVTQLGIPFSQKETFLPNLFILLTSFGNLVYASKFL